MKKKILISAVLIFATCFSIQQLNGQDKTQEQKDKEQKLKELIELQKKAAADQKKDKELQQNEIYKAVQDASDEVEKATGNVNVLTRVRPPRIGRDFGDNSFVWTPRNDFGGDAFFFHDGDNEGTRWDFQKYVKEASFSKQYSFDVEKSAENVVMTVMGDCKEGEIRVKIIMPGGKVYSDILIDESGNLNWRKSFTISDDENKDKAGEWIFKIEAAKATGSFKISLQTY
jgi:hypothetical protein